MLPYKVCVYPQLILTGYLLVNIGEHIRRQGTNLKCIKLQP